MDKKFLQIRNPFPDVRNERHDDKREGKGMIAENVEDSSREITEKNRNERH